MEVEGEKNELLRNRSDGENLRMIKNKAGSQDLADAGDLAVWRRNREENRVIPKAINEKGLRQSGANSRYVNKKVIRKKIIRTHPDGTQTVTFQFVVNCDEEAISTVAEKSTNKKTGGFGRQKKSKLPNHPMGHSLFEEDVTSIRVIPVRRKSASRGRGRRESDDDYIPHSASKSSFYSKGKGKKVNKKRKRDEDDDDIYLRPAITKGSGSRKGKRSARESKPHAKMAEYLEGIRASCEKRPQSGPFHRPVDRVLIPKYYEVIGNPIDLQTIRDNIKAYVDIHHGGHVL